MKNEIIKILRRLEQEGRIDEYNKLKKILEDEHIEIVDIIYDDDRVEIFCNNNLKGVLFTEIFYFIDSP